MPLKKPVSVLVSPLDWGLGHATRCIPIINQLIRQGDYVMIAASGPQKSLLAEAFPGIQILDIPGYSIQYSTGSFLKWGLFFRIPSILRRIKKESQWLEKLVEKQAVDVVISDNRYGLYHRDLFCIFITHQLQIKSGLPPKAGWPQSPKTYAEAGERNEVHWVDRIIMKWNYRFISKFNECWVPDYSGAFSIAGELSHPRVMPPIPVKYIGVLSRFSPVKKSPKRNSLLILLSGPEPQRTLFERILFEQLRGVSLQTLILRGLPGDERPAPFLGEHIQIQNHLPAGELAEKISEAEWIISRSGYSTMMDLITLGKSAIIVPTPGQTEQEYLGKYLHGKKWMFCVTQKDFKLPEAIAGFEAAGLKLPEMPVAAFPDILSNARKI